MLSKDEDIVEIRCNVLLEGFMEGDYSSDFVCKKKNGDLMVTLGYQPDVWKEWN